MLYIFPFLDSGFQIRIMIYSQWFEPDSLNPDPDPGTLLDPNSGCWCRIRIQSKIFYAKWKNIQNLKIFTLFKQEVSYFFPFLGDNLGLSGSGSADLNESGSNLDPASDPNTVCTDSIEFESDRKPWGLCIILYEMEFARGCFSFIVWDRIQWFDLQYFRTVVVITLLQYVGYFSAILI